MNVADPKPMPAIMRHMIMLPRTKAKGRSGPKRHSFAFTDHFPLPGPYHPEVEIGEILSVRVPGPLRFALDDCSAIHADIEASNGHNAKANSGKTHIFQASLHSSQPAFQICFRVMIYSAETGMSYDKEDKKRFVHRVSPGTKSSCAMISAQRLVDVGLTDGVGVHARRFPK